MKLKMWLLAALLCGFAGSAGVASGADVMTDTTGVISPAYDERVEWTVLVPELYDDLFLAGTIIRLDRESGMVGLRSDLQGDVNLQFAPTALRALKVGDIAVVYLGFSVEERTISAASCDVLAVKVANC